MDLFDPAIFDAGIFDAGEDDEDPVVIPAPSFGWSSMMRRHRVAAATHYPLPPSREQILCESTGGEWINGACVYPPLPIEGPDTAAIEAHAALLMRAADRAEKILAARRRRRNTFAALLH